MLTKLLSLEEFVSVSKDTAKSSITVYACLSYVMHVVGSCNSAVWNIY